MNSASLHWALRRNRSGRRPSEQSRRGAIVVLAALLMVPMMAMLAFSIDVGYMNLARTELQMAADASAFAGTGRMYASPALGIQDAITYAETNSPNYGQVLDAPNVTFGIWDVETRTFDPNNITPNAVRVLLRRTKSNGNPAQLFFAPVLGVSTVDINAEAIAYAPNFGFRFLLDEEFLDTDIPAIEQLAASLGVTPEQLLSDSDGDWFIDLPPGETIELPTGQVGDTGLFDRGHSEFPFGEAGKPTMKEFLEYNENGGDSSKGGIDNPDVKALLDPLLGVSAVDDVGVYPSFVSDRVQVSPVFKSDASALNPVPTGNGVPAVNALGMRRGLLAFKIIAVGADPDGPGGSVLPNLVIVVVDPSTIDLDAISSGNIAGKPLLVY